MSKKVLDKGKKVLKSKSWRLFSGKTKMILLIILAITSWFIPDILPLVDEILLTLLAINETREQNTK